MRYKIFIISFKKKIDTSSISTCKIFLCREKNQLDKIRHLQIVDNINPVTKKNFARKFIEQQATKDLLKDNKPAGKSKQSWKDL